MAIYIVETAFCPCSVHTTKIHVVFSFICDAFYIVMMVLSGILRNYFRKIPSITDIYIFILTPSTPQLPEQSINRSVTFSECTRSKLIENCTQIRSRRSWNWTFFQIRLLKYLEMLNPFRYKTNFSDNNVTSAEISHWKLSHFPHSFHIQFYFSRHARIHLHVG